MPLGFHNATPLLSARCAKMSSAEPSRRSLQAQIMPPAMSVTITGSYCTFAAVQSGTPFIVHSAAPLGFRRCA